MIGTILTMILLDAVHPPAVSTALAFSFKAGPEGNLVLFASALLLIVLLVLLARVSLTLLVRIEARVGQRYGIG